jgi:hypothetical protein
VGKNYLRRIVADPEFWALMYLEERIIAISSSSRTSTGMSARVQVFWGDDIAVGNLMQFPDTNPVCNDADFADPELMLDPAMQVPHHRFCLTEALTIQQLTLVFSLHASSQSASPCRYRHIVFTAALLSAVCFRSSSLYRGW